MAKRPGQEKSNRLSMEEAEVLVRQWNEAVFGPGHGDFVSKHTFAATDLATRLHAINWFARCGEPRDFDLTMPIERVKSWEQAIRRMRSPAWENAVLEARNQLTAYLSHHHPQRDREWNNITEKLKGEVVTPLRESVWEPFRQERGLEMVFVAYVEWNILAAMMENAYMGCKHRCFFFHELLSVYENGHLPCGWIGKWPQGNLVVF